MTLTPCYHFPLLCYWMCHGLGHKLIGCFLQAKVEWYSYVCAEPKTKTIKETKWDWELLNDVKAVWLRNPKDVTPEEYDKFYHSLAKVNNL